MTTPEEDFIEFECIDCFVNTHFINEYYMVKDKVWRKAHPEFDGMLCVGCLEKRLGRQLTKKDFIDAPINTPEGLWRPHSDRLKNRLTT